MHPYLSNSHVSSLRTLDMERAREIFNTICKQLDIAGDSGFYFCVLLQHVLKLVLLNRTVTGSGECRGGLDKWKSLVQYAHSSICPHDVISTTTGSLASWPSCTARSVPDLSVPCQNIYVETAPFKSLSASTVNTVNDGHNIVAVNDAFLIRNRHRSKYPSLKQLKRVTFNASTQTDSDCVTSTSTSSFSVLFHADVATTCVSLPPPPPPVVTPVEDPRLVPHSPISAEPLLTQVFSKLSKQENHESHVVPFAYECFARNLLIGTEAVERKWLKGIDYKLKPLRWTKLSRLYPSSVWLPEQGLLEAGPRGSSASPERIAIHVDLQSLERLFIRHPIRNGLVASCVQNQCDGVLHTALLMPETANTVTSDLQSMENRPIDNSSGSGRTKVVQSLLPPLLSKGLPSFGTKPVYRRTLSMQRKSEPTLLTSQRCLNINIFLRQFRSSSVDLLELINRSNGKTIGAEHLRDLVKLLPTEQEVKALSQFAGNVDRLDPAERFFIQLIATSEYQQRIDNALLREEFKGTMDWTESALDKVIGTMNALISSRSLRQLLYTVLRIGNFLNRGDKLGGAIAFKLCSLLKLSEVRSVDPKFTLLHFLVQQCKLNNHDVLAIEKDFPYLKEASGICLETVIGETKLLRCRLQAMGRYVHQAGIEQHNELLTFMKNAQMECGLVEDRLQELNVIRKRCAQYFCEDPNTFKVTEFLQTFNLFLRRFHTAEQEIDGVNQRWQQRTHGRTDGLVHRDHHSEPIESGVQKDGRRRDGMQSDFQQIPITKREKYTGVPLSSKGAQTLNPVADKLNCKVIDKPSAAVSLRQVYLGTSEHTTPISVSDQDIHRGSRPKVYQRDPDDLQWDDHSVASTAESPLMEFLCKEANNPERRLRSRGLGNLHNSRSMRQLLEMGLDRERRFQLHYDKDEKLPS